MAAANAGGSSPDEGPKQTVTSRTADAVGRRRQAAATRFAGSGAEHLWRRLNAVDFINRGMLFAAVLLLCFVPFMIVVQSLAGRSAATDMTRRFGLDHEAASAVSQVFASPSATSSAITGLSYVFFVLSGIAGATAVQELYERVYELPGRGIRDLPRRLVWLACVIGGTALAAQVGPWLHDVGGPVLLAIAAWVAYTGFWWFTIWLLLGGRRGWTELVPAALATSVCWLGAMIVFRITMSDTIATDYRKYGDIGVVFAVMSFLIAIGVVIIIGAVFGVVWRERHDNTAQPTAARPAAGGS
jgi:membrane protein